MFDMEAPRLSSTVVYSKAQDYKVHTEGMLLHSVDFCIQRVKAQSKYTTPLFTPIMATGLHHDLFCK